MTVLPKSGITFPLRGLLLITAVAASLIGGAALTPAQADHDHKRAKGHDAHGQMHGHKQCPPGLAKKGKACQPPGHAKAHKSPKHGAKPHQDDAYRDGYRDGQRDARYGRRLGDRLDIDRYSLIRDPSRYDLARRDDWRYYQDGGNIYRIDRDSQQIIAILSLIGAALK